VRGGVGGGRLGAGAGGVRQPKTGGEQLQT